MLKIAGETGTDREKVELITYKPSVQNTDDLEAATKTITATSEASGVGNADYSQALTLAKPSDARLVVKRIGARLAVTIDSFDTATHLYCRVYVDAQDADHRLFDMDWDSTGAKVSGTERTSGTIFDLLSDGGAHTFYFFFWVNQANNAVISLVQLWEGVGGCHTNIYATCLLLNHTGYLTATYAIVKVGTGTAKGGLYLTDQLTITDYDTCIVGKDAVGHNTFPTAPSFLCDGNLGLCSASSVATDLAYLRGIKFVLRSEQ